MKVRHEDALIITASQSSEVLEITSSDMDEITTIMKANDDRLAEKLSALFELFWGES